MRTSEDSLIRDYVEVADGVFDGIKSNFPIIHEERLAFSFRLSAPAFQDLHDTAEAFAAAALAAHDIDLAARNPFAAIGEHASGLSNLTINGALLPRTEIETEFNAMHRAVVDLLSDHLAEDVFDFAQCPINLRLSQPQWLQKLADSPHPFQSLSYHTDAWAGEPIDSFVCMVPIHFDGDGLNLEIAEVAPATEPNTLRKFESYRSALETVEISRPYEIDVPLGSAVFFDPRALHRTVRKHLGTIRASVDFRFRAKLPAGSPKALKSRLDAAPAAQNVSYITFPEWCEIGRTMRYATGRSLTDMRDEAAPGAANWRNHRYVQDNRPRLMPS